MNASQTQCLILMIPLILAASLAGGCEGGEPETEAVTAKKYPAARISPKNTWSIKGDMGDIRAAIDANPDTAAVSSESYANCTVVLDLGKTCMFNTVILEHGDEMGYCRRLAVATSIDGKSYTPRMVCPGNRKTTIVAIVTPVLARYVQLKVLIPGDNPWSISEIDLQ